MEKKLKGYYVISDNYFNEKINGSIGVNKKILSQINSFNNMGFDCSLINLKWKITGNVILRRLRHCFSKTLFNKYVVNNASFFYIRRPLPFTAGFINFLRNIKKQNPHSIIVLEIPTFPYDGEYKTFPEKVMKLIDIHYRKKLVKYVNLITTYSNHDNIFKISSIHIINGIDCNKVKLVTAPKKNNVITLIAVAQFSVWHGYDRIIRGLSDYYNNKQDDMSQVNLLLVGDGIELEKYKEIVKDCNLTDYVSFPGLLSGEKLDEQFRNADIAINSLGCHRIGIYKTSALKSREYMARGFPIVTSSQIDGLDDNFKYCLKFAEDDTNLDINKIVSFYNNLITTETKEQMHHKIREYAIEKWSMDVVMKPIFDYIKDTLK